MDAKVPWEIRGHIAHFKLLNASSNASVFHIKRDLNSVAHNCAHQAIRQDLSTPIYNCSNSTHSISICPLLDAVRQMNSQDIVILAVHCI